MIDAEGVALGVTAANWVDAPYNRWGFRHVPDLCRTAVIERGSGPARELPRAERDLADFSFGHGDRRFTLGRDARGDVHRRLPRAPRRRGRERALPRRHERDRHPPPDVVLEVAHVHPLRRPRGTRAGGSRRPRHRRISRSSPAAPGTAAGCRTSSTCARATPGRKPTSTSASTSPTTGRTTSTGRSRATPRRGSARSAAARTTRRRAVPLLLARHRRARMGPGAGRRRALPGAVLTRGVVADRRRAGRADHPRPFRTSRSWTAASARRCATSGASG